MQQRKNRIITNASWIVACRLVQALLSFVIGTLSARYLGPSNYGLINYANSIITFVVPLVQLGLRATLVNEIISKPNNEGETIGTSLFISSAASLLGIVGVLAFVNITNHSNTETITVCSLYSISLFFQTFELLQYWFQAKLLSKYVSVSSLIAYTVVSAYRIFLLVTQKSVYWFALSQAMDYLIISVLLFAVYKRLGGQKLSVSMKTAQSLFSRSRYYIVSGIMVTIFSITDRIMLTLMVNEEATGYYSAAITCADVSRFVFAAIIDSVRPSILEQKKENSPEYSRSLAKLYCIIIYLGLAQSIVLTFGAGLAIKILYGADYLPSVSILRIVTWYTAFAYMGTVRNIWILAEGKQRILWKINLLGAVLNIAVNFILIPILGAQGAAIASVAAQFFTNFILSVILKPIRPTAKLIWMAVNPATFKELWLDKK